MEENREQQKLYGLLQMAIYMVVVIDILIWFYRIPEVFGRFVVILDRFSSVALFSLPIHAKLFTLLLICTVGVGTLAKKNWISTPRNISCCPWQRGWY